MSAPLWFRGSVWFPGGSQNHRSLGGSVVPPPYRGNHKPRNHVYSIMPKSLSGWFRSIIARQGAQR